jgi:hypothetical protein
MSGYLDQFLHVSGLQKQLRLGRRPQRDLWEPRVQRCRRVGCRAELMQEGRPVRPPLPGGAVGYGQVGLCMMGLASVPKNRAVGPLYWASPPKVLPLVICPNSHTQCPPTEACVQ